MFLDRWIDKRVNERIKKKLESGELKEVTVIDSIKKSFIVEVKFPQYKKLVEMNNKLNEVFVPRLTTGFVVELIYDRKRPISEYLMIKFIRENVESYSEFQDIIKRHPDREYTIDVYKSMSADIIIGTHKELVRK